jgi:hypothetical protein
MSKTDQILEFFRSDKTFLILIGRGGTGKTRALIDAVHRYRSIIQNQEDEDDDEDEDAYVAPVTIIASHNPGEVLHPIYVQKTGSPKAKIVFVRLEIEENLVSPALASEFGVETIVF